MDSATLPAYTEVYEDLVARAGMRAGVLALGISDERVALNALLDNLKPLLENALALYPWHPGIRDARKFLKQRVLAQVVKHYPALNAIAQIELGKK